MISILEERETIKELFRDVINEVILQERINFYPKIIPIVSQAENENIEKNYGSPDDYNKNDFVDMTDWLTT